MMTRLPDTPCQHGIVHDALHTVVLFEANRWLLNGLFALAADNLLYAAEQRELTIGIFCALHTYGRQLNQHPHIHVSATRGGLDLKHGVWRELFFKKQAVEEIWRGAVIRLLHHSHDLINPAACRGGSHIHTGRIISGRAVLPAGCLKTGNANSVTQPSLMRQSR